MMRMPAFLLAAFLSLAGIATADAKRVALVVGNSTYTVGPLANPVRDAEAIAAALTRLGFDKVDLKRNLGSEDFKGALRDFGAAAEGAEIAVVFFAGHGTENNGTNYLLPIDARLARAADLDLEAVRLEAVLGAIDGARKLKLVILDACRNTLFPLAGAKRAQTRGLARVEPETNTLVAYAAKEGTTADDGSGASNSPFTAALLRHIERPGLEVDYVFRIVRDEVIASTGKAQQPHLYGSLGQERVYLKASPEAGAASPAGAASTTSAAEAAELARLKAEIEELKRKQSEQQQANLAPPPRPEPAVGPEPAPAKPEAPAASSDITPGTTFRDCPECPEMVVVPAGSFTMGSPASEEGRKRDEGPQRKVTIAKPFAVGKFEVTFAEWDACVEAGGCKHKPSDEGWGRGKRPVINVSWDDSKQYVSWLSKKTGKSYRLLTEAEWEYAARAGTTTPFSTGKTITTDQANFDGNSTYGDSATGKYREKTIEVGSFKANAFGLHDMHGNVWEWVEDCYKDSYQGAPTDGSSVASGDCSFRVLRGGTWYIVPWDLRAAIRDVYLPGYRVRNVGFRLART